MRRSILVVVALIGLSGCSMGADVSAAAAGIDAFHTELNATNYDAIYTTGSAEMQRATPQTTFVQFLSAIHRKLGLFISGKQAGWNDTVNTTGHFVTLNYAAQYQRGAATENFVFKLDGNHASLVGYHINSTALVVN